MLLHQDSAIGSAQQHGRARRWPTSPCARFARPGLPAHQRLRICTPSSHSPRQWARAEANGQSKPSGHDAPALKSAFAHELRTKAPFLQQERPPSHEVGGSSAHTLPLDAARPGSSSNGTGPQPPGPLHQNHMLPVHVAGVSSPSGPLHHPPAAASHPAGELASAASSRFAAITSGLTAALQASLQGSSSALLHGDGGGGSSVGGLSGLPSSSHPSLQGNGAAPLGAQAGDTPDAAAALAARLTDLESRMKSSVTGRIGSAVGAATDALSTRLPPALASRFPRATTSVHAITTASSATDSLDAASSAAAHVAQLESSMYSSLAALLGGTGAAAAAVATSSSPAARPGTGAGAGAAAAGPLAAAAGAPPPDIAAVNAALSQALDGLGANGDPVGAAEQLRAFVLQYEGRYGGAAASRAGATAAKLQTFIDASRDQVTVRVLEGGQAATGPIQAAEVSPVAGAVPEPIYHNYLMEGVLATLQWVHDMLLPHAASPHAPLGATAGTSVGGAAMGASAGGSGLGGSQVEQLSDAATRLRALSGQLHETQTMYRVADPEERAALSTILTQLSTIADKLAASGARMAGMERGMGQAFPGPAPGPGGPGGEPGGGGDPLLNLLEGLYRAVVVDSGLRDFLVGIKRLGDSIVVSMDSSWHSVPPAARLVPYVAALAGAFFLLRNRVPALMSSNQALGEPEGAPSSSPPPGSTAAAAAPAQQPGAGSGQLRPLSWPPPPQQQQQQRHQQPSHVVVRGSSDGRTPEAAGGDAAATWVVGSGDYPRGLPRDVPAASSSGSGRQVPPAGIAAAAQRGGARVVSSEAAVGSHLGGAPPAANSVQAAWQAFRESMQAQAGGSSRPAGGDPTAAAAAAAAATALGTPQQQQRPFPGPAAAVGGSGGGVAVSSQASSSSSSSSSPWSAARWPAAPPSAAPFRQQQSHAASAAAPAPASSRPPWATPSPSPGSSPPEATSQQLRELKQHVSWATLALGPVMAVVPGGEPVREEVDKVLSVLEQNNPGRGHAHSDAPDGALLGTWTLAYASNGSSPQPSYSHTSGQPNLFAQVLHVADSIPGLGMDSITHRLYRDAGPAGAVRMENSTVFRFGPLGSWLVSVAGSWRDIGADSADVAFSNFSIRPISFLGLPTEGMPELSVPIPEVLQNHSTWATTYLDQDMRINRGAGGTIFLFRRLPAHEQQQQSAAWSGGLPPPPVFPDPAAHQLGGPASAPVGAVPAAAFGAMPRFASGLPPQQAARGGQGQVPAQAGGTLRRF